VGVLGIEPAPTTRAPSLPDWAALEQLAKALVARSAHQFEGWGEVVMFTACTAARIGETSGVRRVDVDVRRWLWNVRRPTTPSPGGLMDKGTKGKSCATGADHPGGPTRRAAAA
jgi:hypothetical protein